MATMHNLQRWAGRDTQWFDTQPAPAEAATDVGIEDDGSLSIASCIVLGVVAALAIWAAAVTLWVAL